MNAKCLTLGLLLCLAALPIRAQQNERYNLIAIVTDDQARWSVGAYGNRESRTPNMDRLAREGVRVRGAVMLLVARANGTPGSRLGLSVGRVIWKSAVKRNRVRRIFRESFRLAYRDLPPGFDYVLVPARPKLEPALADTQRELTELARKAAQRWEKHRAPREAGAPGAP